MNAASKHSNDGSDGGDKKRGRRDGTKKDPKAPSTTTPIGQGKKKTAETGDSDGWFFETPHNKPVPEPVFLSFRGFKGDSLLVPKNKSAVTTSFLVAAPLPIPSAPNVHGRWHCTAPHCSHNYECPKDGCKYMDTHVDTVKKHVKEKHKEILGSGEYKRFAAEAKSRNKEKVVEEGSEEEEVVVEETPAAAAAAGESSKQAEIMAEELPAAIESSEQQDAVEEDLLAVEEPDQPKSNVATALEHVLDTYTKYKEAPGGKGFARMKLRDAALALAKEVEAEQMEEDAARAA